MWGWTEIENSEYSRILGRGGAIIEGEERKGATRLRGGEEGGVMTSIHLSHTRPLHTRMKQCPRRNTRPGHFPSHNTRLWVVALAPRIRQRPSVTILAIPAHCGAATILRRPQRWAHPWSTNIQPYFVILFYFLSFCLPSLTILRL